MMKRPPAISLALALATLASCANITFKRGASADAMAADERACRDETTNEAGYADCMRERGSYVAGGSARNPSTPVAVKPPPTVASAPLAAPGAAAPSAEPTVASPLPSAAVLTTPLPSATATPADPLEQISVASWWKIGASPADLDNAISACVTKLGPAHRPEPGATVVTIGLRDCLRQGGWFAVGKAHPR